VAVIDIERKQREKVDLQRSKSTSQLTSNETTCTNARNSENSDITYKLRRQKNFTLVSYSSGITVVEYRIQSS
jgi:hypothetical protein